MKAGSGKPRINTWFFITWRSIFHNIRMFTAHQDTVANKYWQRSATLWFPQLKIYRVFVIGTALRFRGCG